MKKMLIGQLAKEAGVKPDTVRFYERKKLLLPPARSATGYRIYDETTAKRLRFIKQAQALGFSLDEIARVMRSRRQGEDNCCDLVVAMADALMTEANEKLRELRCFRDNLSRNLERWRREGRAGCDAATEFCQLIESASMENAADLGARKRPSR